MITSITTDNQQVYQALFDEATQILGLQKKIETLEEYFNKIEELKAKNLKFTKLPIINNEEYFNIDANTRTIKVPSTFQANGLGVQGDMGAETVYFRINRYYDAIDLGRTVIWIQWETDTHKGITTEYLRDIESEPDYLIFGWTIGKLMTESKGNITFSVRFLVGEIENEEEGTFKNIKYSFGTKPAMAIINPTINADPTQSGFLMDNSANQDLLDSIINTTTSTDNKISIFRIVEDLDALAKEETDVDESNKLVYLNLELVDISSLEENDEGENGESSNTTEQYKFTFKTQAYSYPGEVFYYLCYQEGDSRHINTDPRVEMSIEFEETKDNTVQAEKDYYSYNSALDGYYPAANIKLGDTILETNPLYERFGQYTIYSKDIQRTFKHPGKNNWYNSVNLNGKFYAIALVRISDRASSPRSTVYTATFPSPEIPSVIYDMSEYYYIPSSGETKTLTATVDYKGAEPILYQWYKKGYGDDSYQKITGATESDFIIDSNSSQAYYALQVTSKRNGAQAYNQPEGGFYVTKKLEQDDYIITEEPDNILYINESDEQAITINVQPKSGIEIVGDPTIQYAWKRIIDMGGTTENVTAEWHDQATVTKEQFEQYASGGTYRCEVTINYNGSEITIQSQDCGVVSGSRPSSTP